MPNACAKMKTNLCGTGDFETGLGMEEKTGRDLS